MRYEFEWDPRKAKANIRKHNVSFERATMIFRDPNVISIPDEKHSESEDRWITMGLDESGSLLVLSHVFKMANGEAAKIRVISARKATKKEEAQYEEGI